MPKALTAQQVSALDKDGTWRVDRGLYLQLRRDGATRSWLFRYKLDGRVRWMGLGSALDVRLREAQGLTDDARRQLRHGVDPIEARRAAARPNSIIFSEAAKQYIAAHASGWSNAKHGWQWSRSLEQYAFPTIGKMMVSDIGPNDLVKVLQPIWATKSETAGRVRNRIERILAWAENAGYRSGPNPATWRGGLEFRLAPLSRVQTIEHHTAIPYSELPAVFARLATVETTVARCLRFIALTAVRAGEARKAMWGEFDLDAAVWTIPAERMKTRVEHRVPLSAQAVAILRSLWKPGRKPTDLVFHGARRAAAISDTAMRKLLRKHGPADADVHGLRSAFRDWAAEKTSYPSEVPEAALAHTLGSSVTRAYLRSDFFEQRQALMAEWASYLAG